MAVDNPPIILNKQGMQGRYLLYDVTAPQSRFGQQQQKFIKHALLAIKVQVQLPAQMGNPARVEQHRRPAPDTEYATRPPGVPQYMILGLTGPA